MFLICDRTFPDFQIDIYKEKKYLQSATTKVNIFIIYMF